MAKQRPDHSSFSVHAPLTALQLFYTPSYPALPCLPCQKLPGQEEDAGSSGVVMAGDNSHSPSAHDFHTCLNTSS